MSNSKFIYSFTGFLWVIQVYYKYIRVERQLEYIHSLDLTDDD